MKRLAGTFITICLSFGILPAQSRQDCLQCHADKSLTMERKGKEVSIGVDESILNHSPHAKLACVACHTGFDPNNVPHKEKITPVNCQTCHADAALKHPFHPQMTKANGMNGTPDISCKNCHGKHDVVSPKVPGSKFYPTNVSEACQSCHKEEKEHFAASAHGKALAEKIPGAPTCISCHQNGRLHVTAGSDTLAVKIRQEKLCLSCHLDDPNVRARMGPSSAFIASYEHSVHGNALSGGNAKAANCVNCHGSHEMKKGSDPASRVNKKNIPATCGTCHTEIKETYSHSVHGAAMARGVNDAPVCTNCHGEHNILAPSNPNSPVAPLNVSGQVCAPCHNSVKLTEKFGIASNRFQTFSDSYHGLAVKAGSVEAANCASCHGSHDIKSIVDSTSRVNKQNLATTCGKCHANANARFAEGRVHVAVQTKEDPMLYWIGTLYLILIVSVVGGMFIHNAADFLKKAKHKLLVRRGVIVEEHTGHGLYLRMTLSERLQHGSLMVSFTLLVITGFMLRYPEAWWVLGFRSLSERAFEFRGIVHRVAAVVMVFASLYHCTYLIFTERGKKLVSDMLPRLQDATDAVAVLRYNFGFSTVKPKFGRFSYIEKSEYWALVWGTAVMAGTGFVMWFDNTFIGLFSKLGYDVARLIHFYEAWLATLAIIVWHFYYVIFNPDTYPMNLAWFKGTISEQEMAEEHPLELEEVKRKEQELLNKERDRA